MNKHFLALVTSLTCFIGLFSCQTGDPHYISKRDAGPVAEQAVSVPVPQPPVVQPAEDEAPKEAFVRSKELKIRQKVPVNTSGSLTDLNDPRAYLFGFERPIEVGQYVNIKVASNRDEQDSGAKNSDGEAKVAAGSDGASKVKGADEAALVKALPNLDPGAKNKPVLVKNIKMQIMERLPNGEAVVMYKRRSVRDGQGAEISVTGRLSAEAMSRPDAISTLDLADVDWRESADGEIVERKSANWEDEYSLRISGFDETKSKDALALEDKREMLKSARDKLETEMKNLGQERTKMSKERSALLEEKTKDKAKIAELEQQSKDLQKKVDDLSPKDESPEDANSDKGAKDKANSDKADQKDGASDKKKSDKADPANEKSKGAKPEKPKKDSKPETAKKDAKKPAAAKKG